MRSMLMLPDYRVRQREYLLDILRAITSQLDLDHVLRLVLNASAAMLTARVGLVALRDETDGMFHIQAVSGIEDERIPDLEAKLHELVEGAGDGIDYDYLDVKLREMAVVIDRKLRQSIAMPLIFAEKPLGLLIVFRSYQSVVTPDDLQILQSFASQAAIAVHNAQMYESINHERKRLEAILEYSGDAVMILDPHLAILQVNRAFERMTAWPVEDVIGLVQDEVLTWRRLEQGDLRDALDNGWPFRQTGEQDTLYVEGDLLRRDGLMLSIGITYSSLFSADGRLSNIIASIRDITNFRRAQEMQNVFISTISHELRTPIALIKGYASTLCRDDVEWEPQMLRETLQIIEEEADRLNDMVGDLLTASKIQAERTVSLKRDDVRIDLIAARSVERLGSQTEQHKITLSFPDDFPLVCGDERLLRQVIDNLLSNAIKYSPNGGKITVGGQYDGRNVTIFVRDTGIGIPEDEQGQIFERFYRIDNNLSRKTKGTGLGLYLARMIVEAHGGRIYVKSRVGQGSTFYFTLPLPAPAQ